MTVCHHLLETAGGPRWFSPEGEFTAGQLAAAAQRMRRELSPDSLAGVALRQPDNFRAAVWLAALDGVAGRMLLLPASLADEQATAFCAQAGCETMLSRDPLAALLGGGAESLPAGVTTRWIIPTSGTTGTPKLVSHTLATLMRSAQQDKTKGAAFRWGLLYDVTRFAGLQVFLQAVCGGSALIFPDVHAEMGAQVEFLAARGCNALSATPTLWRKILMMPESRALPLRHISMGGEIADRRVLEAVTTAWPEARVRHIYASTEAGVGFSIADGKPGFPAAFLEAPPPGVELRVDDANMLWLRPAVRGQDYIQRDLRIEGDEGWIPSGDIIRLEGDRFLFCGRENGAINVGGNKVFPQEVEEVILQVPGVAAAVVAGRANPIMGQLVEVRVVAQPGIAEEALRPVILSACREKLQRWQIPAMVKFVPAIATTGAGKASRI